MMRLAMVVSPGRASVVLLGFALVSVGTFLHRTALTDEGGVHARARIDMRRLTVV
jgi:hypothetical protein